MPLVDCLGVIFIEKNEPGFPAKSKVAAGHLDYYLGSAAESVYPVESFAVKRKMSYVNESVRLPSSSAAPSLIL